jgi:hypothetical protein
MLLRKLTHQYYAIERAQMKDHDDNWQWDYKSRRFRARFLSHSLHLLESMIIQVRDEEKP